MIYGIKVSGFCWKSKEWRLLHPFYTQIFRKRRNKKGSLSPFFRLIIRNVKAMADWLVKASLVITLSRPSRRLPCSNLSSIGMSARSSSLTCLRFWKIFWWFSGVSFRECFGFGPLRRLFWVLHQTRFNTFQTGQKTSSHLSCRP